MTSLQLGMLPVTIRNFHYISPAGFLLNPPSIALAGIIMPLGMLLMLLSAVKGPVYIFLAV